MAYTRYLLSGSTNGKQIPVAAVATPGTLIHTALPGVVGFDEIYLFANNPTANPVALTIEWGGVAAPGDHIVEQYTLPPYSSRVPIISGEILNNALVVRAYASVASGINVGGYVNRIL